MIWWFIIPLIVLVGISFYVYLFYPQQQINVSTIQPVTVTTPDDKYHNDCLHPCIRKMSDGRFVLVQSPWYKCQDGIENPILYISDNPMHWDDGIVVADTPKKGYNSDPNVYEEKGRIYVFWREVETELCDQLHVSRAVVGVYTDDEGKSFSEKEVFLTNSSSAIGTEICPILIKRNKTYRFYATWYETVRNNRHNIGIAIWEGSCLEHPDFQLIKTVPFKTKCVCDKYKQMELFRHLFFIPMPHKFDLWHFDLFENAGKLYMVASEEMKDVIMLAKSDDWENFVLTRKPLINAHYMENRVGYRQQYYKPTIYWNKGMAYLFYTSNPPKDLFIHTPFIAKIAF